MKSATRARLRLAVVAVALVPVAILARIVASGHLAEFVQRGWANAWRKYDKDAGRD